MVRAGKGLFYTRKGQLSPSSALPYCKYTTFFARKQEMLIRRKANVKKGRLPVEMFPELMKTGPCLPLLF